MIGPEKKKFPMIFDQVENEKVTGPRFWVNMTYIYVIGTERVNDLRVKFFFGQILFF